MAAKKQTKPKETPRLPKAAKDLAKGSGDAGLALEERKKIIGLEKRVDKLQTENAALKKQIKSATPKPTAGAERKKRS